MGGACGMRGREEMRAGCWLGNVKEGDRYEDIGRGLEDNIKMDRKGIGWGEGAPGMDWINLTRDRNKCWISCGDPDQVLG